MGKRGPQPKPTALKILEGNPGKRRLNEAEPVPPPAVKVRTPPRRLLPEAKREWKRLAQALVEMGVLTEVDWAAFAEMCQCYAYYLAADAEITKGGGAGAYMMQVTENGYASKHPLLSIRQQHLDAWRRALQDFGLTPASRSRIISGEATIAKAADPMERILGGGHHAL